MIDDWLGVTQHQNLIFRVAVRAVESWLLADRSAFANFLEISIDIIPMEPDNLDRPKVKLINLARRSRNNILSSAIVPGDGSTAPVGPDYNGALARFIKNHWEPGRASKNSPSLQRTLNALNDFRPRSN